MCSSELPAPPGASTSTPPRATSPGKFEEYEARDASPDMSFLELLDVVNENLPADGREPIAFDHDRREGICASRSRLTNGRAHGPEHRTAPCHRHPP